MLHKPLLLVVFGVVIQVCCGVSFGNHAFNLNKEMTAKNMSLFKLMATLEAKLKEIDQTFESKLQDMAWSDCGSSSIADILSVSISPDPPQKGAALTIGTKVQLYQEVSGGKVNVNIKYLGYIPVLKETFDLCELATRMDDSCPLSSGVHENYISDTFPDFAFSGQYSGTVKAVDDYNNELACITIKFKV